MQQQHPSHSSLVRPQTNDCKAVEANPGKQVQRMLAPNEAEEFEGEAMAEDTPDRDDGAEPEEIEARQAQCGPTPHRPSAKEVAEHNVTHLRYRSWCPICVRAKGISEPHYAGVDRSERTIPAVSADYCFLCRNPEIEATMTEDDQNEQDANQESEDREDENLKDKATILDVKDTLTGCIRAHWVPYKGVAGAPWVPKEIAKDMTIWGHGSCVFKSDQERSLVAVYNEVVKCREPYRTIPEHSPKGDSQANGLIERANRSVKAQIRTFLSLPRPTSGSRWTSGTRSSLGLLLTRALYSRTSR